jgi:renalase
MKIAIIGAGVAGLAAARALSAEGHDVELFDKGRGPGGRASTRRAATPLGEIRFDHGAQFLTVRHPAFSRFVAEAEASGDLALWQPRFFGPAPPGDIYVGQPAMNQLVKALAVPHDVTWGARVSALTRGPGGWSLSLESGDQHGPFDKVVIAVPAEQVAPLIADHWLAGATAASEARSAPCWAAMLALEGPIDPGFDAYRSRTGVIGWMAREASKPGRIGADGLTHPGWVVHANQDWSRQHLEDSAETVAAMLAAEAITILGSALPVHAGAHRWRYAQIETAGAEPFLMSSDGLGLCGDWCIGPRIEAAFLSGMGLGKALCA